MSVLEELVKKVLDNRRGKEYPEKAYRKLYDSSRDIAEELDRTIQEETLKKESLDEKAVNAFIQYYALEHKIELNKKLSWHSCRI